jgi:crotonobetainyl-CoA:carnitine CoA-transferase CaiB-like acyl-CoA transferase
MPGFPLKFAAAPCRVRHHAPELGEHSGEILTEIGFGPDEIRGLRDLGVV